MNPTRIKTLLTSLLVAFAACYTIYVGVRYFYTPYNTEIVYEIVMSDSIRSEAVIFRDEQLISTNQELNIIGYTKEDGEIIIPHTVVAKSYDSKKNLESKNLVEKYKNEISLLERAENATGDRQKINAIYMQINDWTGELVYANASSNLEKLGSNREELHYFLAREQVASSGVSFSERISYLNDQYSHHSALAEDGVNITTNIGGVFCSDVDGYETILVPSSLETMTVSDIEKAVAYTGESKPKNIIGKVMKGHDWYMALVVTKEEAETFELYEKVDIDFGIKGCRDIPAEILRKIEDEETGKIAIIIKSNRINEELISLRHVTVDIRTKLIGGLQVNADAIRYSGDIEGVYVIEGGRVVFKAVDVVWRDEDFVICKEASVPKSYDLKLFDEVIIEGVDLYDGKLIN